ncbi:glycosyltransferase family 4 protein [Nocardia alba]|uniref:Glycosyltransferase involved in cell wall biosynthesis n=1 Tax=Nocardia alba TaxID=225051 RepID=A0A4R1FPY3_9NOCA|nr:glycosyltransferase family 1 protein [Nocardia alba]TCJ97236.1 glycosyltransferase involved in cell wall biosynthesis [Nocardia alba]
MNSAANKRATVCFGALAYRPDGAGVSTYQRELLAQLPALLPGAQLSALVQTDAASSLPATVSAVSRPVAAGARRAWHGVAPLRGFDVFHGLDVDLPLIGPRATVATVHDLSVFDVPWAFSRYRARGEQVLVRTSLTRADLLIAVSEFTAERIADRFGRTAVVVPLAPAAWARVPEPSAVRRVRADYDLPARFILQVGTVEPRKQVAMLAEVAQALGIPLVLAGAGSTGPQAPATAIGLGYVDVADLPALYAAATVVAYCSEYEGFGLPPVEAMACGGAVVAGAVGALPQVCGDGAVLVARADVESWSAAVRPLLHDSADNAALRERGLAAASKLSWRATAEATVDAYRGAGLIS